MIKIEVNVAATVVVSYDGQNGGQSGATSRASGESCAPRLLAPPAIKLVDATKKGGES